MSTRPWPGSARRHRRRWPIPLIALVGTLALIVGMSPAAANAAPSTVKSAVPSAPTLKPDVNKAAKHDKSPVLRDVKPSHQAGQSAKTPDIPLGVVPHKEAKATKAGSAATQTSVTTNTMPAFTHNFDGLGNENGVLPPDTQGDVGPNNYVQMVNLSFAVYDKQGNRLLGPLANTVLWQGFGGPCETVNGGDPVTMYDEQADRWFMSQLAYPGGAQGYHQCIAISQTPDPTGAWYRYDFLFSQTTLNDYPKFGIWRDAYYASANEYLGGATFTGVTTQAYQREAMLAGQDAAVVSFHIGDSSGKYGSLLPTDAEGGALGFNPPSGAPDPFVMFDDDAWGFSPTDRILMWDFHVDWATPANSTFGNNGEPNRFFETAPFDSNLCNYARSCIRQPGTSVGLDTLADRLMYRAAYRNFGDHQGIALTQSVDTDGTDHAGVRWYQLNNTGSGWNLADQGTYAPDGDSRWMGSAALDASGDLAVGFSVSSTTTFPSIRVAGRLAGDPSGQLAQGEAQMVAGAGSQTHSLSRWGDYSAMQVDPTDGCTFWYTTEYMPSTSTAGWQTRIGSLKFPSCTAGPHGDLVGTVTNAGTGAPVADAVVAAGPVSTTTNAQGKYSMTLPVGSYDVSFSAFGYVSQTATGVAVTDGGTTTKNAALQPSPSVKVSGTVTDGSGHGYPLYARIDVDGRPGGAIYTDPVTGRYSVDLPQNAAYQVKFTALLPGYQVVNRTISVGTGNLTSDVAVPVDPGCTAPGYRFNFGTPVIEEHFDQGGTAPPAGWQILDNNNSGTVWTFNDPGNRGNLTGGTGGFAMIDSDKAGVGHTQNTTLVSPELNLSAVPFPDLQFNNDYRGFSNQTGDVDVSTDGGAAWTNVWRHTSDSVRGPNLQEVLMPFAGGKSSVKLRFHFIATFGWWWEVDNLKVTNRSCDPIPGGLVVGNVKDVDTGAGINGATVVSGDKPADKGTTTATPDDPANPDGYYWLFSTLTGTHPFTASKAKYESKSADVNVAANGATRADFALGAGHLQISPATITQSQVLGSTTSTTVHFSNTGSGAAKVQLGERKGSFQILTKQGSPLYRLKLEADGDVNPAGWLGDHAGVPETEGQEANAGPPADPTWGQVADYPSAIMDNAADQIDGKIYSVGGYNGAANIANGYVYDPDTDSWSAIASMANTREKPAAAAIGGKLYVSGGWSDSGAPVAQTEAYDPAANSWSTVANNPSPKAAPGSAVADDKLYLVGGCSDGSCTPSNTTVSYDPATNTWATLAPYPHANAWLSCGGIDGKVYCAGGQASSTFYTDAYVYDPAANTWTRIADMKYNLWGSAFAAANGLLVISSGLTGASVLTNQGLAYDPASDTWSDLPNAQFPRFRGAGACGFYKVGGSSIAGFSPSKDVEHLSELDQCGVSDVPWLSEAPTEFTLQPGQSVDVTVNLAATTAAGVTQPGAYAAQLTVKHDTPDTIQPINVTMNVTPPTGWGKIAGTVTGKDCAGRSSPLSGAQVQANGKGFTFSLSTATDGSYAFWAPAASNAYSLIASKDGWASQTQKTNVKAGKTVTVNFALAKLRC